MSCSSVCLTNVCSDIVGDPRNAAFSSADMTVLMRSGDAHVLNARHGGGVVEVPGKLVSALDAARQQLADGDAQTWIEGEIVVPYILLGRRLHLP